MQINNIHNMSDGIMAINTKIEWTDATWSPVTGCTKVSPGCKHCYAERLWKRLSAKNMPYHGREFTNVQCHPERLNQPLRWRKPRRVFVNSMSDLFHENIPFEFIASIFAVMSVTTRHTYQVLTKRPERMKEFFEWVLGDAHIYDFSADEKISGHWPEHIEWDKCGYDNCGPLFPYENIWIGVSVEDQQTADERIIQLLRCPAAVRWLSIEPMLGPILFRPYTLTERPCFVCSIEDKLDEPRGTQSHPINCGWRHDNDKRGSGIDWIVVGGESGPKAREMKTRWIDSIVNQCCENNVPLFVKQMGSYNHKGAGANIDEWPKHLRIREYPTQQGL